MCINKEAQNVCSLSKSSDEHGYDKSVMEVAKKSVLTAAVDVSAAGAPVFAKPSIPSLRSRPLRSFDGLVKKGRFDPAALLSEIPVVRLEAICPGIRTRRDTRSGDSKGVESIDAGSNHNPLITCKGSSSSSNHNNNHLPLLGSSSSPLSATVQAATTASKMGVLCTEKHDLGQRCDCENMAASSPRPASVSTTPASPCESNTSSPDSVRRTAASRKRSLDAALHQVESTAVVAAARRRTHRSPSVGSINGVVPSAAAATIKEPHSKLSTIAAAMTGQNGFKREAGLNGVKLVHGYQNGTRPPCCLGLEALAPGSKGMAHHHPAVVITALSSPSSTLPTSSEPVVAASPVSLPGQNGRGVAIGHNPGSTTAALSRGAAPASNSVTSAGSTSHLAGAEDTGSKKPQPPSSASSPLTDSPSAGQLCSPLLARTLPSHPATQGSPSSSIDNGSSIITTSSIDSHDDRNNNSSSNSSSSSHNTVTSSTLSSSSSSPSVTSSTSKNISASPNSTVLSLRHRPLCSSSSTNISSNTTITQKSLSQPASPQPSSSSRSTSLTSSSSLPSLSTLVTDPPPSPSPPPPVAQCRWRDCSCELDASDLLEHIRKHVEAQIQNKTYACLWADCKVFNKASWSASWLERHMVSHSGHRPFKCILDNCGQRFHSQAALERHVNGHFAAPSQNGVKTGRTREDFTHRMLQKRKKQMKRRFVQAVKRNDYIDDQTMVVIKHELVSLAEETQLDLVGSLLQTTFHGSIVGRRSTKSGSKEHLLEFQPNHVLDEKWFPEEESKQMARMLVPLTSLPKDILFNLHNSIYRPHRFRKHRRK